MGEFRRPPLKGGRTRERARIGSERVASGPAEKAGKEGGMQRKKATLVVIAALSAIGLALPATAGARSFAPPQPGVQNVSMVVNVSGDAGTAGAAVDVVSWGD